MTRTSHISFRILAVVSPSPSRTVFYAATSTMGDAAALVVAIARRRATNECATSGADDRRYAPLFLNCLLAVLHKTFLSQPHSREGERVETAVGGNERWRSLKRAEYVCVRVHASVC
jgi:hypothetical protein